MSKYYKAEDVIRKRAEDLADTSYWEYGNPKNVDEWIEVAEMEFKDLPTIEVSEEVLKATKKFNCYTIADENAEMGMRTEIEPIIEVSEDCISREYLKSFEYINKGDFNSVETIREWIDNAPSVVPKPKEGEWEIAHEKYEYIRACSECGWLHDLVHYGDSFCPNCGAKMKGADE